MKEILLTSDKVSPVDDWNFEWLNRFKWFAKRCAANGRWYAYRNIQLSDGRRTTQLMHRLIMGEPSGLEIDHIDKSPEGGLDNREANLRIVTSPQNQWNQGVRKNNTSGFKGVNWHKSTGKWIARIRIAGGRRICLGQFDTPEAAAQAYNEASVKYHGEFGFINPLFGWERPTRQMTPEQKAAAGVRLHAARLSRQESHPDA